MMRRLLVITAVAVVVTARAQERCDTTVIKNAEKVTIVTGDSLQRIVVEGMEGNKNYYYQNTIQLVDSNYVKRKCEAGKKSERFDFDLGIGWSAPTNVPDGMSMAPFKSWEWIVGLRYKYTPPRALQTYSVGLWCNWRMYTLSTDMMFEKGANSIVGLANYPANASSKHSDIHVFSLSVPLFFSQRFGHKCPWSVTIGPVVNFNLSGRIGNEYELGDDTYDVTTKGLEYRPVTVDFMGVVKYRKVGLYFKYSPMSVLKKDKGPQFHALSFGVFL